LALQGEYADAIRNLKMALKLEPSNKVLYSTFTKSLFRKMWNENKFSGPHVFAVLSDIHQVVPYSLILVMKETRWTADSSFWWI
jgi:hypothetical protein